MQASPMVLIVVSLTVLVCFKWKLMNNGLKGEKENGPSTEVSQPLPTSSCFSLFFLIKFGLN